MYLLYGSLVLAMTVFLLYGRPPITERNAKWLEISLLAPGTILYLPLLLLSGGVHWSLPFGARMPLWGILNVFGYLAIPLAGRTTIRWWRGWKTSGGDRSIWLELLQTPATMVLLGLGMLLLGLNGAIRIWQGIDGPPDTANMVLAPVAAIGFWCLAYYLCRYGTVTRLHGRALPAWMRWAVPVAEIIGGIIGGGLTYGEVKILRWSTAAAGTLAVTVTVVTVAVVLIVFRVAQKHHQKRF